MSRVQDFGPAPLDEPDAYPGTWPTGPVIIDGDRVLPLAEDADPAAGDRTPIVAYGSNACPAQIARKALPGPVLLTPAILRNHIVVYAGHVTLYGAVPATVARWPGASTEVFLAWLTPQQHLVIDGSEGGNYDRVLLPTADGLVVGYRGRTGFTMAGRRLPVRVAGVHSEGRSLPAEMTQVQVRLHRRAMAG
ncbi:hypothetical protein BH23ACT9_BH23ACT9_40190 [soil metagenome]